MHLALNPTLFVHNFQYFNFLVTFVLTKSLLLTSQKTNMILTITMILSFLVAVNFLLLIFSCNKTSKKVGNRKPRVLRNQKPTTAITSTQLQTRQLAATGS